MKLIIAATALKLYPLGKPSMFYGGTERYVHELARGLSRKGHTVHVVTADLEAEEQRGPSEWWWPPAHHPTKADAVISVHNLADLVYDADLLVWASNGIGADLGGLEGDVNVVATFSECHGDLIAKTTSIARDKCVVTGLGVDLAPYPLEDQSVPGRLFTANDPQRGLIHVLDIFDLVKNAVPAASLHVGYDFDRQFEMHRWSQTATGEMMWECRQRIDSTAGIVNRGALSPTEVVLEQIECQVHCWPSDPPNIGSQIHGITQMECGAAGCALVLSDIEAFPEVFGAAATILPTIGRYYSGEERRIDAQDYADQVIRLMAEPKLYAAARRKAQRLAAKHTWAKVIDRWDALLKALAEDVPAEEETPND